MGDIVVPEGTSVEVVVHDPGGAPIAGALVAWSEPGRAGRTDSKGLARVVVADAPGLSLQVTALGFECVDVPIPEDRAKTIEVTLRREAVLEVRVVTRAPASLGAILVSLSADVQDAWDRQGDRPVRTTAGASRGLGGWISDDGRRSSSFSPDGEGRVVVAGVRHGTSIVVEALDVLHAGAVLASRTVTASPGEWKLVELDVAKTEKIIRGRVRDSLGAPVIGARVIVGHGDSAGDPDASKFGSRRGVTGRPTHVETTTDAAGVFELAGVYASPVALAVDKVGYAPLVRRGLELGSEDIELELTLDRGLTLQLAIVDADGTPVRGLAVWARSEGQPDSLAREREPGVYSVADVSKQAAITVSTVWARRQWTWSFIVAGDHTERVTMPAMGRVVIEYPPVTKFELMTLDLEPAGEQPHVRELFHPPPANSGERSEITLSPVVPGDYAVTLRTSSESEGNAGLRGSVTVRPASG